MKRRIFAAVLLLLVCFASLALAAEYAVVTGGRLNLRERPSAGSASLGRYTGGSWVRLEGDQSGGWYRVSTMDGKRGYMMGSYLTFRSSSSGGATVRYAQGGYVNLRSGPSLETPVVTRVNSGTSVTLRGMVGSWYAVSLLQGGMNYSGYIHESLINTGSTSAVVSTRNGGRVNVRSGPSFSFGSLGSLATGTRVNVLLKGTGWTWISGGGITGFMSSGYLSESGYVPTPTAAPYVPTGTTVAYVNNPIATQVLNLRDTPSRTGRSLAQYRNGKEVRVINYGATWCEVYVDGMRGYMMTQYLRFTGLNPYPYYTTPVPTRPPYYGGGGYDPYIAPVIPAATPTPTPLVQLITPAPVQTGPQPPAAGDNIQLAPAAGGGSAINVYRDAQLTTLLATYSNGKQARMLKYGDYVCMILIDGSIGYVSTGNVNY